ncbi:NADH dehydrogenase (ubiquinone) complex I, assembly factor 6 [Talaromyces islandicus]|uniref:NADH dehydrogenase (Ubiquinone) complex I, assembly factor 6 n=1 Tax=Talaromyces islandicus TaxID=28573 RepID=A0A0U1M6H3_TALIS|nr:NADH dehydrogenase (ubiquinone) complex I, assembly factor 6 [Talaromyces islandicus]
MSAAKKALPGRGVSSIQIFRQGPQFTQRRTFSQSPTCRSAARDGEVESARKYCMDLVRKYDRSSYVLSTFIPPQSQSFYLALQALNISLSMIPDTTSSHTIGLMRLQFWRDTISRTLSGSPPKEPVAIFLGAAIEDLRARTTQHSGQAARLSKGWFLRMINARERSLTNTPYTTIAELESYAENTYSTLLYLTLSSLPLTSLTVDHVASHVGKAAGIAAVLRGLPLVAFPPPPNHHTNQTAALGGQGTQQQGAITLPLDVMAQAGVKEEDIFRQGAAAPGLKDAVFAVATRANDHLITARQMLKNLRAGQDVGHEFEHEGEEGHEYAAAPSQQHTSEKNQGQSPYELQLKEVERGFGVLMPAIPTQMWLDKLEKVDFDIFNTNLLRSDWKLPWKAYLAHRSQSF